MARANIETGQIIDGFRIEERLHRGGMAAIWRVTRDDIDFPIILKLPFLDFEGDISMLVGFEVEQMIFAELSGPHVPRFVANGDFSVLPYIVMEFIPGQSLQAVVGKGEPLPLEEAMSIGARLAQAIADLHHHKVLHLDLKPANIMFRPTGEAVLIDFGLSRHEELPDLLEEQFHSATGTPEYMAPEQLFNVRSDRRSDVYAIGAILYQLVTGKLPFGAPPRLSHVRKRLWRDPVPPKKLRPDTPDWLQEVILRCLEPNPAARYASAADLYFDLSHTELVVLTERARRTRADGFGTVMKRRFRAGKTRKEILANATAPKPRPPIVMVAVDLRPGLDDLRHALLETAASVLANTPGARLACANVMPTNLLSVEENVDADGDNVHVRHLAELRHWAEPLGLPRANTTYHLLESIDVAGAILDFARSNKVMHLIVGLPTSGEIKPGSVPAQIKSEAPCPVTFARAHV